MRITLLAASAAIALLASCNQSADNPPANAVAANDGPVLPVRDNAAVLVRAPANKAEALTLMHDRHENMEKIGKATKAIGRELKATSPDLATIRSSAAVIAGFAPKVPAWFPAGTGPDVGKTQSKAEIWQKPQDFSAKSKAFEQAAVAFQAATRTADMAAINARFAELGKTCKACHDPYRSEHKK
jgi:cytochrome c556